MRSLQSRLGTGLLLSLIISFSVLWALVSINVQYLAEEYISSRLEHDAEGLLGAVSINGQNGPSIDSSRVDPVYNQPFSGHYYMISTGKARFSSRSLWDQSLDLKTPGTGSILRSLQVGPENQSLLVISVGYTKQGQPLTISIAENLDPIKQNIERFRYWFAAMAIGMLTLLVIIQSVILRSSLKPLGDIRNEIHSLEQGKLDKLSTDAPAELRPLIDEINHLLSVVEQRLRRSRDALGDLAHTIKKPLTVIKQQTDNNDIPPASRDVLVKQADEIYQQTDRILKRARLAGHIHSGSLFSFEQDLPDLVDTLTMIHAGKTLRLSLNIPHGINCPVDREDMLELLGNLLDNAYKWARNEIVISVNTESGLGVRIEDDGPGADPDKLNELSKRGVRLDEKVDGHGFGLAIAADIVTDYNGQMTFEPSDDRGGFAVEIKLPLKQSV